MQQLDELPRYQRAAINFFVYLPFIFIIYIAIKLFFFPSQSCEVRAPEPRPNPPLLAH